ncbi:MAG: P27 family phage terminase small subunit [Sulfurovaceae bacterium]|nr:P27 family phage terminase small subunit [Sulfurovaceae bacterium]
MSIEQNITKDKNITKNSFPKERKEYKKDEEIDWGSVQFEYENIKISDVKLAEKYGTYSVNIKRKATEGNWLKFKKQIDTTPAKNLIPAHTEQILGTIALRKIKEIRDELGANYSTVDEALIVMYGKTYQRYLELEAIVDKDGYVKMSPKTGGTYINPYFSSLLAVEKSLLNVGDKLGLSIESRKKLGILIGDHDDKAKGLFDMLDDFNKQSMDVDI